MRRWSRGTAGVEFALAWPIVLLAVLGSVELGIWAAEVSAARSAALAGARAGSTAGASAATAQTVALSGLRPALVGARPDPWCPGQGPPPQVWICVHQVPDAVEVTVGGWAPALVPLVPGHDGLPLHAHARLPREVFR